MKTIKTKFNQEAAQKIWLGFKKTTQKNSDSKESSSFEKIKKFQIQWDDSIFENNKNAFIKILNSEEISEKMISDELFLKFFF